MIRDDWQVVSEQDLFLHIPILVYYEYTKS